MKKFWRTNQDTAINQRPLVQLGQQVGAGEIIADGAATEGGELALGSNVLVAFMPWYGHNFEDAIVLSERLVKDDVYSSIHIQELELHVRDTKRGQEEITREIPNVSDESVVDLDERGIVRIGAHVKPGDILVGKITPKGETELSPEEKLLTAIFGEKAKDVKDSSLKVPPGMAGVVIDVKIFSRIEDQVVEKDRGERIGEVRRIENDEKARINTVMLDELNHLLDGQEVALMLKAGTVEEYLACRAPSSARRRSQDVDLGEVDLKTLRVANKAANERIRATIDMAARERAKVEEKAEDQIDKILQPDELPPGVIQLVKVYIAEKRKISVGDKMAGRHGNKGIVARIVPEEDMPFLPDGTPGGHRPQPARRAEPDERGSDPRDPPGLGGADPGLRGQDPGLPRRRRGRDRRAAPAGRASAGRRKVSGSAHRPPRDAARRSPGWCRISRRWPRGRAHDAAARRASGCWAAAGAPQRPGSCSRRSAPSSPRPPRSWPSASWPSGGRKWSSIGLRPSGTTGATRRPSPRRSRSWRRPRLRRRPRRWRRRASRRWRDCSGSKSEADMDAAADELLRAAGLTPAGKARLRDGRTGQPFEGDVTVGSIYMLKLSHLVDDKIHARSIGPYSLVTQQPLAGKAQFGGQRFGEMEVWALEAYGAAHVLQEMLTVKSDDVNGRSKVYEAIVKGQNLPEPGIPESFNVLVKELQALGLKVTLGTTEAGDE